MLATLASAAAAPPLAPPGAADAPTLDLYVGDERRTTITTNFGTATEALAAAVLRAGDPGDAVEGRVVLAARIGGEAFEFVDPPSTALRPGDALGLDRRRDEYREEHPAAAKRAVVLEAGLAHGWLFDSLYAALPLVRAVCMLLTRPNLGRLCC